MIDYTAVTLAALAILAYWLFRDRDFNEKDLVSFGNYLLSKSRFDRIKSEADFEYRYGKVSDKDIDQWLGEK